MHLLTNGTISTVSFHFCGLPNHKSLSQAVTELRHSDPHQERTCHTVGGVPTASGTLTQGQAEATLWPDTSVGAHMPAWTRDIRFLGGLKAPGRGSAQPPVSLTSVTAAGLRLSPPPAPACSLHCISPYHPPGTCHLDTCSPHNPN